MKKNIFICCLIVLVSACASTKPTSFYSITAVSNENVKINDAKKLNIGIDFVSVPGYLERPQIVTIKNDNELNLSEFNRWAEPLSNSMQRVVSANMSSVLKKSFVRPASSNRRSFDYIVLIELNKLDGKFGESAELDTWWTISDKTGTVVANEHSSYKVGLGDNYDDLVQKQSELINKLSIDIARKISKLK